MSTKAAKKKPGTPKTTVEKFNELFNQDFLFNQSNLEINLNKQSAINESLKRYLLHKIDDNKYPRLQFKILPTDLSLSTKEMLSPLNLDSGKKLLYSTVWKNGDMEKIDRIIDGIKCPVFNNNTSIIEKKAFVFRQFGKYLSTENEPIIDQNSFRAYWYFINIESINKLLEKYWKNSNSLLLEDDFLPNMNQNPIKLSEFKKELNDKPIYRFLLKDYDEEIQQKRFLKLVLGSLLDNESSVTHFEKIIVDYRNICINTTSKSTSQSPDDWRYNIDQKMFVLGKAIKGIYGVRKEGRPKEEPDYTEEEINGLSS